MSDLKVDVKDKLALKRLANRLAEPQEQIDNGKLPAGSNMYFYCRMCGHQCDVLPESYTVPPKKFCVECRALKDANLDITEQTLVQLAKDL